MTLMPRFKRAIKRAVRRVGFDLVRHELPRDFDEELAATIRVVQRFTMTTPELLEALVRSVRWICDNGIAGAVVECGVWRGGSMMAVARTLLEHGDLRELYLFDTFSGMTAPGPNDLRSDGKTAHEALSIDVPGAASIADFARADLTEVKRNMATTAYPPDRIRYIKGNVEDTIPSQAPPRIALLRLDTDWYESTRHELKHLFPLVSHGGIVIVDDYGAWKGARKAVDEYLAKLDSPLMLHRIDFSGRLLMVP
jgi:hypothetical protein